MSNHYALLNQDTQFRIDLNTPAISIGRDETSDIFLKDSDLSRTHAKLFSSAGGLIVVDLDSTNGTYVNGNKISEPTHLVPGDLLQLGHERFEIIMEEPADGTHLANARDITRFAKAEPPKSKLSNFLGLFPFAKSNNLHGEPGHYVKSHQATIERYLNYFRNISQDESGLALFFYKQDHTVAIQCVTSEHNDNKWSIGRCETSFIIIDDPSVSKHHADIFYANGKWQLRDNQSTNGILVKGSRLAQIAIKDRSDIRLGDIKLYARVF